MLDEEILSQGNSYLTILPDHDIVAVSVSNAQYISSYTVASTRESECLNSSIQVISRLDGGKSRMLNISNYSLGVRN